MGQSITLFAGLEVHKDSIDLSLCDAGRGSELRHGLAAALALNRSAPAEDFSGAREWWLVSDLWRAEVNRRRAELRAGRVQAAPWAEVRQRLGSL